MVGVRLRPDQRRRIAGSNRASEERVVRKQRYGLLTRLGFERDPHDRALVLDRGDPARQMRPTARGADAAAIGPNGNDATECRYDIVAADKAGDEGARRPLE